MQFFYYQTGAIVLGYLLDLIFGDPYWLYHPVRIIGKIISILEKLLLKKNDSPRTQFAKGSVLALTVIFITGGITAAILAFCYRWHPLIGFAAETVMCYQILAVKSLKTESMKVYSALENDGIKQAREAVAMIVGRDTDRLDESGVIRAAVETVAENSSDGAAAPLFYMCFFGAAGGFVYKAVNTMDSMLGYKNDKYLYFGRFAARLDDCANFIPSRLAGHLMVVSSGIAQLFIDSEHYNIKNAWKIYRRDKNKHTSPNAAHTEAACAGALGISLSGDNYYFGKLVKKPRLGDPLRLPEAEDIKRSNVLHYITAFLMVLLVTAVRTGMCLFAANCNH